MKLKILVSGDSFTDKNWTSAHHPDLDTSWKKWPELLGEMMNAEVINVAKSGSGPEYIFNSIIDELKKKNNIDLVIAAWSKSSRRDYKLYNSPRNLHLDTHGDTEYFIERQLRYQFLLQELCKHFGKKLRQFSMLNEYNGERGLRDYGYHMIQYYMRKKSNDYYNLIEKNFIGFPGVISGGGFSMEMFMDKKRHVVSELDTHPNEEGQKVLAKEIYERLEL